MQTRLLVIRKYRNLTQKDVADKIDMNVRTYGRKERGEVDFTSDEMFAIAELFDLKISDIFLPRNSVNNRFIVGGG